MFELTRIIIADDHPLFRGALYQAVYQILGNVSLVEAENFATVQDVVAAESDADLLLLDLHMPGANGFSGLAFLRGHYPGLPVVMVSADDAPEVIQRAMGCGAAGFISKTATMSEISQAIRSVLAGNLWFPEGFGFADGELGGEDAEFARQLATLTPQQFRVLTLLTDGLLNKQIAGELCVSEATVKAHVTAVLRKLGVYSRTQAVIAARRLGAISSP